MKETINPDSKKEYPNNEDKAEILGENDLGELSPIGQIHSFNHENTKKENITNLITEEEIDKLLEDNKK